MVHTSREEDFLYDFVLGSGAVRTWAYHEKGLCLFGAWVWDGSSDNRAGNGGDENVG